GGGFWISTDPKSGKLVALDFRERAPKKLGPIGTLKAQKLSRRLQNTPLGAGVPGFVAGMQEVHRRFGKLPWKRLLQPAIRTAKQGFAIYPDLAEALADRRAVLARDPDAARIFLHPDRSPRKLGERLIQKDLAQTLEILAEEGAESFYTGRLSVQIASWLRAQGSAVRAEDLRSYQVLERKPLVMDVLDHRLAVMPLPSSGGILLPQILKLLEPERKKLKLWGPQDEKTIHRLAQAMQLAYADRARYLGDPGFTKIPEKTLLSDEYLDQRRALSFGETALKSEQVSPMDSVALKKISELNHESSDTTHLSLIDVEGNAIATTQSINGWMGSGQVISGTGIVLNNTMDDFSIAEGVKNLYGAIGSKPNRIQPRKTPLSSMTPTLVFDSQNPLQPTLAIGAPGGTRIITCILQVLVNQWVHGMPLSEAIARPRIHHQWIPDQLVLEDPAPSMKFSDTLFQALQTRGHPVVRDEVHCRVMATERQGDQLSASSDPRDIGVAIVR
ncbi:MAG: gamma-glutamyltransferase, partial [Bdellovibrionales bacterium]|nr:gamma-glutamyltransferase [Bdellovibrionales bacterium]